MTEKPICPHCNPCRNGFKLAEAERLNEEYDFLLREICSYLGVGGFNSHNLISPNVARDKIWWG